jgi:hypothetical protein
MKRLLMLNPLRNGSGDTTKGKVYEVVRDVLYYHYEAKNDDETDIDEEYEFDEQLWSEHPDYSRWVTIKDNSSQDDFEVVKDDNSCVVCSNDKELAFALINHVDGLDEAIVNMYLLMNSNK